MGVAGVAMTVMLPAVAVTVTVAGLMVEEGEHAQQTKPGVHVDSHGAQLLLPCTKKRKKKQISKHVVFFSSPESPTFLVAEFNRTCSVLFRYSAK